MKCSFGCQVTSTVRNPGLCHAQPHGKCQGRTAGFRCHSRHLRLLAASYQCPLLVSCHLRLLAPGDVRRMRGRSVILVLSTLTFYGYLAWHITLPHILNFRSTVKLYANLYLALNVPVQIVQDHFLANSNSQSLNHVFCTHLRPQIHNAEVLDLYKMDVYCWRQLHT